jgi:hypothetical protein
MTCSRVQTREITLKEFLHEKEHPHKWFKIRYHELGNIIWIEREFQDKYRVRQYLDNPMASDISITVVELVDDG